MQTVTSFPRTRGRKASGFSLIELLVVVAILALLVGIGVNTLAKSGTQGVDKTGNAVSSIAQLARQHATSMNTLTALVIGTVSSGGETVPAVSVWDFDSSMKPNQVERWNLLPSTVKIEVENENIPNTLASDGITYKNSAPTTKNIFWFYPDGRIGNGSAVPKLTITPSNGASDNSYALIFNPVIGTHKVSRPSLSPAQ